MARITATTFIPVLLNYCIPTIQMTQIFVYGTLKKGQPNYHRMLDGANGKAEFCCRAHTVESYPLVIAGKYNIPFLLNVPGTGWQVSGEVYRVDGPMLQFLDKFESVPQMYQRTPVRLQVDEWECKTSASEAALAAGSIIEAFVYSTTTYQPEWLSHTFYSNYDAYGDHGLQFCERENRH